MANLDLVPSEFKDVKIEIDEKKTGHITNYRIIAKTTNPVPANGKF